MLSIDSLDNQRYTDKKTGNSLLFTFEDAEYLTIDIDSSKVDPDCGDTFIPLNIITINIKTGKIEQPSFIK